MTQFEDFNHVNADVTDKTKLVTTKFVLGFCHGQFAILSASADRPFVSTEDHTHENFKSTVENNFTGVELVILQCPVKEVSQRNLMY